MIGDSDIGMEIFYRLLLRRDNLGGSPDNQDEVTPGPAGGRA